ncbi:hypothetical protein VFPBJ_11371 [Purpureocillium lilacinum]|uniref:Uncharacterized protein n=1 Tax=Purpureocillium lilacinum TaxID=33203 RepID=A0A179FBS1_PURLI|nr:hypothetical protein VFPBJ_11371 [Purpureocillium lilacinum]
MPHPCASAIPCGDSTGRVVEGSGPGRRACVGTGAAGMGQPERRRGRCPTRRPWGVSPGTWSAAYGVGSHQTRRLDRQSSALVDSK